jgi:RHS repeat-associated protein
VTQVDNAATPGVPNVVLNSTYDAAGNRTQVSASGDFENDYTYDALHRLTRIEQSGASVSEKRIDLAYNAAGEYTTISRYEDLAGTQLVASSTYTHDDAGRLTALTHAKGGNTLADYTWNYDAADRVTQFTSTDGTTDYSYDNTDQLTAADHSYQTDEGWTYDANGNRNNAGYVTGTNNRLLSDGTYDYQYDDEGNLTKKTQIPTGDAVEYTWDHRNRLTGVTFVAGDRLSGEYDYNGLPVGVAQDGDALLFRNENGGTSAGHFADADTVVADGWGGLTGDLVGGQIQWANGSVWTRNLAGNWANAGAGTQITQNGASLTFINEFSGQSAGYFADVDTVVAVDWGNLVGEVANGRIEWANGSAWDDADLPHVNGWYTFNGPGDPHAEVGQRNGHLEFVNENGGHSDGEILDENTVVATDWGNLIGRLDLTPGKIEWANGSNWIRSLDGAWEFNGQATTVVQTGLSLHFINENGGQSIGHFVDIDHVIADDWNDLGAVLSPGEIAWVNQSLWTRNEPTPEVLKANKQVLYTYDVYDRLIRKQVDDGGDGSIDRAEAFVYDGDDVVQSFDGAGSLTHRYLHGPAVDQVFADEDALGEILWGLGDNQGTIRDVADYDAVSDTTTIANHREFTAFGELTSDPSTEFRYFYTGRYLDPDTGLQNNGARWYDATIGRWMSEDPIGFAGGDANLSRYVGNGPTNAIDPSGLQPPLTADESRLLEIEIKAEQERSGEKQLSVAQRRAVWNRVMAYRRSVAAERERLARQRYEADLIVRELQRQIEVARRKAVVAEANAEAKRRAIEEDFKCNRISQDPSYYNESALMVQQLERNYQQWGIAGVLIGPGDNLINHIAVARFVFRGSTSGSARVFASKYRKAPVRWNNGWRTPDGKFASRPRRLHDPKTGRFISDPNNPPSPYKMTDAQRRANWKRLAQDPNSALTAEQRAQIEARGWRGPQRLNPETGEIETMELSHEPIPQRHGGKVVVPRWPADHAAIDPCRYLKKR